MDSEKILLILSSSLAYPKAIKFLEAEYPNGNVDILLSKHSSISILTDKYNCYLLNQKSFTPEALKNNRENKKLLHKKYDLVIILMNSISDVSKYENVKMMAKNLNTKQILGFDQYQNFIPLSGWSGLGNNPNGFYQKSLDLFTLLFCIFCFLPTIISYLFLKNER